MPRGGIETVRFFLGFMGGELVVFATEMVSIVSFEAPNNYSLYEMVRRLNHGWAIASSKLMRRLYGSTSLSKKSMK